MSPSINPVVPMTLCEDNSACLRVIQMGRFPTMKHVQRTQRCNVHWLSHCFQDKELPLALEQTESDKQSADIFTKAFANKDKWSQVRALVNIFLPSVFFKSYTLVSVLPAAPASRGEMHSVCPMFDHSYVVGLPVLDAIQGDWMDANSSVDSHFDIFDSYESLDSGKSGG